MTTTTKRNHTLFSCHPTILMPSAKQMYNNLRCMFHTEHPIYYSKWQILVCQIRIRGIVTSAIPVVSRMRKEEGGFRWISRRMAYVTMMCTTNPHRTMHKNIHFNAVVYYFCTNLWKCLSLFDGFICSDGLAHTYRHYTAAAHTRYPKVSSDFIM